MVVFALVVWLVVFCVNAPQDAAFAFDKQVSSALSHYIMGVVYEDTGDIDKAIREYKKALRADNRSAAIHASLASGYIKKDKIPEAIEELNLAVQLDPESVTPHAILALLYSLQNKPEQARNEYEAALKKASKAEPDNLDIYKSLGASYLQSRKFKEALEVYRLIVEKRPQDAQAHFYLGSIYNQLKDPKAASLQIERAIQLKSDYAEALNFLGYLLADKGKELARAEAMIKKALAGDPGNGAYVDSLGWCYFKKGDYDQALKELQRAASLILDPVVFDHLGDAYLKTGDVAGARLNWQRSLDLDPKQEKVREKLQGLKN